MLRTRPVTTALTTTPSIEFVTVAALERETSKTHFITMSKETFLTKGAELNTVTSLGTIVNVKIIRANGVNTALIDRALAAHPELKDRIEVELAEFGRIR